jgi:hypothetical protein
MCGEPNRVAVTTLRSVLSCQQKPASGWLWRSNVAVAADWRPSIGRLVDSAPPCIRWPGTEWEHAWLLDCQCAGQHGAPAAQRQHWRPVSLRARLGIRPHPSHVWPGRDFCEHAWLSDCQCASVLGQQGTPASAQRQHWRPGWGSATPIRLTPWPGLNFCQHAWLSDCQCAGQHGTPAAQRQHWQPVSVGIHPHPSHVGLVRTFCDGPRHGTRPADRGFRYECNPIRCMTA